MNEIFKDNIGTKVFAKEFFDFQKTIPQDRYIEPKEEDTEGYKETICITNHGKKPIYFGDRQTGFCIKQGDSLFMSSNLWINTFNNYKKVK